MHREEQFLVGLVVGTAILMLLGSGQYAPEASIFPRVAAAVTIVFGIATVIQDRFDFSSGDESDLLGRVTDSAELGDQVSGVGGDGDDPSVELGEADPGEFRIDQPTMTYEVPFTTHEISIRLVVAILLLIYLGLVWLLGVLISSFVFLVLYWRTVRLRPTVFLALAVFTALSLILFGMFLETPLMRPGHEWFTLPEVGL